ncbi:hypothetical protein ACFP3Q_11765 [Nocardioides sp. GCM10027113]|uniref:hypothetical protein n=1 Tax=unclassified Nocardioides TaxID=2615069 RepID=UPI003613FC44
MTQRTADNPAPLLVAASLVAVEGAMLLMLAVLEGASTNTDRLMVGLTTTVFFAVYGVGLLVCAQQLTRGRSWARSPLALAQLIQLGVAWNFRGGETTLIAVALAVVALVVLAGLLHPASVEALAADEDPAAR